MPVEPSPVCQSVCLPTLLNINIFETRGLIATKLYLKHHWGRGKAALGFEQDRIGTLVSTITDSSHRVIMGDPPPPKKKKKKKNLLF